MGSAWERIGYSDLGEIKQALLGVYENIQKFLMELPASNDPQSKKLVLKAEDVLRKGFAINKDTAVPLNDALADAETRAELIRISQQSPEALFKALDQIKENPDQAKTILVGVIMQNQQGTLVASKDNMLPERAEPLSASAGSFEAAQPSNIPTNAFNKEGPMPDKVGSQQMPTVFAPVQPYDIGSLVEPSQTTLARSFMAEGTASKPEPASIYSLADHSLAQAAAIGMGMRNGGLAATSDSAYALTASFKARGNGIVLD